MNLQLAERAKGVLISYWFIPLLFSVGAVALAALAAWLDVLSAEGRVSPLAYFRGASPAGARAILSTIAGASISVAGLVFSITMVVLSMASAQLGPRLLPNFFRRKSTQVVLGGFLATFLYALLALVQVTEGDGSAERHSYALGLSVMLAASSFGLLVYFLNSVTSFIQVPRVIDDVARDFVRILDQQTEPADAWSADGPEPLLPDEDSGARIRAPRSGYLQALDAEAMLRIASENDLFVWLLRQPGQYVEAGDALAGVTSPGPLSDALGAELRRLFVVGVERTNSQDIEFALDQLVEIALRALSPGINDPYTAINCIDRLGGALSMLATRRLPPALRRDASGRPRLRRADYAEEDVLDAAFDPLRRHGCSQVAVAIRLMEVIAQMAQRGAHERLRRALRAHLERIREACQREIVGAGDLRDIEDRYREAAAAIG